MGKLIKHGCDFLGRLILTLEAFRDWSCEESQQPVASVTNGYGTSAALSQPGSQTFKLFRVALWYYMHFEWYDFRSFL